MKIVDRKTFLTLPANTVFSKYEPCAFGPLCFKGETIPNDDFVYQGIADAIDNESTDDFIRVLDEAETTGASVKMDFDSSFRDGCYDANQLFAVWDKDDVELLIARLRLS